MSSSVQGASGGIDWGQVMTQLYCDAQKIAQIALPILRESLGTLSTMLLYYTAAIGALSILMLPLIPLMPTSCIKNITATIQGLAAFTICTHTLGVVEYLAVEERV